MSRNGKVGRETSTIIHIKKPKRIECDCVKCIHGKAAYGQMYCKWFGIFNAKRKKCIRYYFDEYNWKNNKGQLKGYRKMMRRKEREKLQQDTEKNIEKTN